MEGIIYFVRCKKLIVFNNVYVYDINIVRKQNLCKIVSFLFIKNTNTEDNMAHIAYINNGGFLTEGYIKYKELQKNKNVYFKKMTKQPSDYINSGIIFVRKDIEYLLSNGSEAEYNKCYDLIVNRLINTKNKQTEDYKKLYNYWRDNCYSKKEFYKLSNGDQFITISVDYNKIKKSKEKIHKELIQMFALLRKSIGDYVYTNFAFFLPSYVFAKLFFNNSSDIHPALISKLEEAYEVL